MKENMRITNDVKYNNFFFLHAEYKNFLPTWDYARNFSHDQGVICHQHAKIGRDNLKIYDNSI